MPGGNKKVTHTQADLQLSGAGLLHVILVPYPEVS